MNLEKKQSMSELKPCPFCGGEAKITHDTRDMITDEYRVKCLICGTILRHRVTEYWVDSVFDTKEQAIEAWNRRVAT